MVDAYKPKTDVELETLAQDLAAGKVFHSDYHGPSIEQSGLTIQSVFMTLFLMDAAHAEWLKANDIVSVYEYLDKAGPRSVNGLPCFMSCCFINREDAEKLHKRVLENLRLQKDRLDNAQKETHDQQ